MKLYNCNYSQIKKIYFMKFPTFREVLPIIAAGVLSTSLTGCTNPFDKGPNSISEADCTLDATKMLTKGGISITQETEAAARAKLGEISSILDRYQGSTLKSECHMGMRQLLVVREELRKEIDSRKKNEQK
jgi:hypothetical protein